MRPNDWTGRRPQAPPDLPFMMPREAPATEGERLALRLPLPRGGKRKG